MTEKIVLRCKGRDWERQGKGRWVCPTCVLLCTLCCLVSSASFHSQTLGNRRQSSTLQGFLSRHIGAGHWGSDWKANSHQDRSALQMVNKIGEGRLSPGKVYAQLSLKILAQPTLLIRTVLVNNDPNRNCLIDSGYRPAWLSSLKRLWSITVDR